MMNEARQKRVSDIFKLGGNVYVFDSTTIDLCLSGFWWAKFRKKKGGIKVHTLYDIETQVPAFFHITEASVHDSKAMKEIPYESGSYYIFDRAYNNFKMLYKIHQIQAFFVIRAKKNLQYKVIKWKRRLPKNAVRIQIYVAICTYCLVAIIQKDMQLDRSTYEVLEILSISLTDKTHLRDLFEKPKLQDDKDRLRIIEPNLFDF